VGQHQETTVRARGPSTAWSKEEHACEIEDGSYNYQFHKQPGRKHNWVRRNHDFEICPDASFVRAGHAQDVAIGPNARIGWRVWPNGSHSLTRTATLSHKA